MTQSLGEGRELKDSKKFLDEWILQLMLEMHKLKFLNSHKDSFTGI